VVKLPSGEYACGAAGFSDFLVRFGFLCQAVQLHLHGALHVVAELSALVLDKAFNGHFSSWLLHHPKLISIIR